MIVVIIVLAVVVLALIAVLAYRAMRTRRLRGQFGEEYDRTRDTAGTRREAEADLMERRKRRESFEVLPLSPQDQARFQQQWVAVQGRFVDHPADSVREADVLVTELMRTRGYPMDDFEQRAGDISVDHPELVTNYREAHAIRSRSDTGSGVTTEDLRAAMVHYRSLFEELLGARISTIAPESTTAPPTTMPEDEEGTGRRVS
jgi:hypothetical protein